MTLRFLLVPASFLLLTSCDKSQSPETTPPPSSEAPATGEDAQPAPAQAEETEPGAPEVAWSDKTFKQRQEFMGIYVMPKMKETFQAHSAEAFQGFKCQTCHGDDMKEKNFAMPTDSILPLSKENTIQAAMEYDEEVTKFMVDEVVPQMATLLKTEPYNPETGQGFGCFGCHPAE